MTLGLEPKRNNLQRRLSSRICQVPGLRKALGWALVIWGPGPRSVDPLPQNLENIKMQIPGLYLVPTESESLGAGGQDSFFFFPSGLYFWQVPLSDSYQPKVWDSALDHLIFFFWASVSLFENGEIMYSIIMKIEKHFGKMLKAFIKIITYNYYIYY